MTRRTAIIGLLGLAMTLTLGAWGCSNLTPYHDPSASITTTQTPTALIDPATLKVWMDEGKVNNTDPETRDRVVIVTVATPATYAAGHIAGSVFMNSSELNASRLEAVAALTSEPPDGPTMDALVERLGIDGHTTIVFSMSGAQANQINMTRAYYLFRYWGFPKERLKVLNGGDDAWTGAGYTLTTDVPSITASTYSVRSNYHGNVDCLKMRTAVGPMIDVVDKINAGTLSATSPSGVAILDARGGITAAGPYVANVAVDGSGVPDDYRLYYVTVAGKTPTFKATSDMVARLAVFGVTAAKQMTYVYCASGHRATTEFFVLDGILGWPVSLYDGSTGQWFQYTTTNNVGTAWRVDTNSPSTTKPRTFGTITSSAVTLDPTANTIYTSIMDPRANQIFNEDKAYLSGGGGGGSTGGGGGTGSPSGC